MLLGLLALAMCLAYHLFCLAADSSDVFSPTVSILLSAAVCAAGVLRGGWGRELLAPQRVLAGQYLMFYPLFALLYLEHPIELSKWYGKYFILAGFPEKVAWTVFFVTLSLPLFQLGCYWGERSNWGRGKRSLASGRLTLPTKRIELWMILLTIVGVGCMVNYAVSLGGIGYMTQAMGDSAERKLWRGNASFTYYPGLFLMTAPAVCLLAGAYDRVNRRTIWVGVGLLAVAVPTLILTQAAREKAMVSLIVLLMCLYFFRKRSGKPIRLNRETIGAMLLGGMLLGAFLVQSAWRHPQGSSGGGRSYEFQLLTDFNRIDVNVVMFFDFIGKGRDYLYGLPFLSYIVQPFVRLFGFEPIANTSAVLGQAIFRSEHDGNPGAPFAGELYVNFGYAGYLAFVIIGYFFGIAHRLLVTRRYEFWTTVVYCFWLFLFTFKFCIANGLAESLLVAGMLSFQLWILRRITTPRVRHSEARPVHSIARATGSG